MRAARIHEYGPVDVIRIEDVEPTTPGPGQVRVAVHATSVNPVDCKIRAGKLRLGVRWALPHVLGLDLSGVVESVGPGVTALAVGDEVFASPWHTWDGTSAELAVLPAAEVARKPASIDHLGAASLPLVGLTAYDCLVRFADVQPGEKVLILGGAGGVGTIAIQIAKALGAEVATTASPRNAALVRGLGADHVVDYTRTRPEDALPPQDVTVCCVGGDSAATALRVTRKGGRIAHIVGDVPVYVDRWGLVVGTLVAGLHIAWFGVACRLRGRRGRHVVRRSDGAALARLAAWVDEGRVRPVVHRVYPLAELAAAHAEVDAGKASGKVVVSVR